MLVAYFKVCGCVLETRVIRGMQTGKLNIHGSYAVKRYKLEGRTIIALTRRPYLLVRYFVYTVGYVPENC
jgi:hypothetical protein